MDFLTNAEATRIQKEFRIPVDSHNPGTYWIVSLDRESLMPTDEELRQLRSFCKFQVYAEYNPHLHEMILSQPLIKRGGHNTIIFRNGFHRDPGTKGWWRYRRINWLGESGPLYVPETIVAKPLSLIELMDKIEETMPERWVRWKRTHPEIFPYLKTTPAAG